MKLVDMILKFENDEESAKAYLFGNVDQIDQILAILNVMQEAKASGDYLAILKAGQQELPDIDEKKMAVGKITAAIASTGLLGENLKSLFD